MQMQMSTTSSPPSTAVSLTYEIRFLRRRFFLFLTDGEDEEPAAVFFLLSEGIN